MPFLAPHPTTSPVGLRAAEKAKLLERVDRLHRRAGSRRRHRAVQSVGASTLSNATLIRSAVAALPVQDERA